MEANKAIFFGGWEPDFKILVSEQKCKNNFKNRESQRKYFIILMKCLCNVVLRNLVVLPRF